MRNIILKIMGAVCALTVLASMLLVAVPAVSAATVVPRAVQIQWTDQWKNVYYGGQHLYDTGCGIFATVNAIGYVTGNEMSITEVAQWAYDIKALNYYAGGTDRTILYPKLQEKFGAEYGFTVDCAGATGYWQNANATLRNHLLKGGVAIGHVYGHFIAVVGYNASTGYYHVYDSAPSTARGTGNGDAWVSESWFTTSTYFTLDWFCLVTATGNPINRDYGATDVDTTTTADKLGTYMVNTETLNVRAGAGTTYDIVTTVKQGDMLNVTALADNGWGQFVAPDGTQGWANVTYYGKYIGVDALAATKSIAWGDVKTSLDSEGRLTLTNQSTTGMAGYDFKLSQAIGTATTPSFETAVHVNNNKGFFFGLSNGGAYYMMRDCTSGDALVEASQAPYMTGDERITVDVSEWWKPSGGERIKMIRFYLAPGASITIEYLYFASAANTVNSTSYNLEKNVFVPVNDTLMSSTLSIPDRTKSGGYTYQNGVLTVESKETDSYSVMWTLDKTYTPDVLPRLLFSVDSDVRYDIELTVATANGDQAVSLAMNYGPEICTTLDGAYLPAAAQTAGLGLNYYYSYNNCLPADGVSAIRSVKITLGGKGTLVLDALQVANSDQLASLGDGLTASDSTPDAQPEPDITVGDVNNDGVITTTDARLAMLQALTENTLTGDALAAADYNGDGKITTTDARLMMLAALSN